jgi:hypothetical protein
MSRVARRIWRKIDRMLLADRSYSFLFEPDTTGEVVSLGGETHGFVPLRTTLSALQRSKFAGSVS